MDKADLLNFVELMEASPDTDKCAAFVRMQPADRTAYLYNLRAFARDESITLKKRATLLTVERALRAADIACRNAGR